MNCQEDRRVPARIGQILQTLSLRRRNPRRALASTTPPPTAESSREQTGQDATTDDTFDMRLTELRYNEAVEMFLKNLKLARRDWEDVEFPSMNDPCWNNLSLLQNDVKKRIMARQAATDHLDA